MNMRIVSKLSTFSCHHCLMAGVCTFRNSGGTWDRQTDTQADSDTSKMKDYTSNCYVKFNNITSQTHRPTDTGIRLGEDSCLTLKVLGL